MSMPWSYKKLWKKLIDKDMNKQDLSRIAGLNSHIISQLSKNESVSMSSLDKICNALDCDLSDIVEHIKSNAKT